MTSAHDSMPEPPPAEPGVLRLRIDPNWASTGQVAVRATPGLARVLLTQFEEQGADASFGSEFGLDANQLFIVVFGGSGVWLTLRTGINAIVDRHKNARIRVEVGDRVTEVCGRSTADMERLLELGERLWQSTSEHGDAASGDGDGSPPSA
ncbi:hypothetical protein [Streptomyces sp. NPDC050738]|uniref:hypothetical protein n=1 Tax=Streptomyces sp. NPDC050738 TaxID=3154744 RepID=UPI003413E0FD